MTPAQKIAYEAVIEHGGIRAASRALGNSFSNVHRKYHAAKRFIEADEAIQNAMNSAGMKDAGPLHSGWIKSESASLYFQMPKSQGTNVSDVVRDAFKDIPACPSLPKPNTISDGLLTVYPLFDCHIGMKAWAGETGEPYDNKIAEKRIVGGIGQCIASAPASESCIILVGGDLLHANDQTAMTASGHILDVDGQFHEALGCAIRTMAAAIDMASSKHENVIVSIIRGNHDRDSYLAVLYALGERYRKESRVNVQKYSGDFFAMEWGKVMLVSHHGDKAKAERLVMHMADEWPEMWGRTRFRHYFTGHLHHAKIVDIGGVQVEQFRAITPRDSYSASNGYSSRSDMQAITYHKERGEISRLKVAL